MKRKNSMSVSSATQPRLSWYADRHRREQVVRTVSFIICSIIGVTYLFPFYWMIVTALKTDQQIFQWPPLLWPTTPQWENFLQATRYIPFWLYMKNTLVICLISIIGTLISCTLIAYGFARVRWPGREIVFIIYLSTLMLPGQVTMIPLYIIFQKLGWVGTILPLVVPSFFGNTF